MMPYWVKNTMNKSILLKEHLKSSKQLLLKPKHYPKPNHLFYNPSCCASSAVNPTLARHVGQVAALRNQVSTHFLWNTCPQPGSLRHHRPFLNPSRQTTHSLPSGLNGLDVLNWGSFCTNVEDNPPEGSSWGSRKLMLEIDLIMLNPETLMVKRRWWEHASQIHRNYMDTKKKKREEKSKVLCVRQQVTGSEIINPRSYGLCGM